MLCPSYTLELRSELQSSPGCRCNDLIKLVLDDLERFIKRMADGPFKLRPENPSKEHESTLRKVLACVSHIDPERIEVSYQSLAQLIEMEPEGQLLIYSVAGGSIGRVLQGSMIGRREPWPFHEMSAFRRRGFDTVWDARGLTFEDLITDALRMGCLRETLRDSRYGGFAPIFERSIVLHFCWLFSFAYEKNVERLSGLLPLTKIFRSNMPIGRYNVTDAHTPKERWLVFTE